MGLKIKKRILGIDFDLDLVAENPLNKVFFLVLDYRLKRMFSVLDFNLFENNEYFIKRALELLPNGFFIVFNFGSDDERFVQFCKLGGDLILDMPVNYENLYKKNRRKINEVLKSYKLHSNHTLKGSLEVNFHEHYTEAAKIALILAEKILETTKPKLSGYSADKLIPI